MEQKPMIAPAHSYTMSRHPPPWKRGAVPSQAELRAIDRSYAIAARMGVLDRLRDHQALREQVQYEALIRAAGSTP